MNPPELRFTTPQTLKELSDCYEEFKFLQHFSPLKLTEEEFQEVLVDSLQFATLVHVNGVLFGCFIYDVFNDSVELHGIVRADAKTIFSGLGQIKKTIYNAILEDIFNVMGRAKVVLKAKPDNVGVRGFAILYGFKRLPYMDKGRVVWVLHRRDYNGKKETKKDESGNSNVSI